VFTNSGGVTYTKQFFAKAFFSCSDSKQTIAAPSPRTVVFGFVLGLGLGWGGFFSLCVFVTVLKPAFVQFNRNPVENFTTTN
jgi:hypothetical protein